MDVTTSREGNNSRFARYRKKRFLLFTLLLIILIILTGFIGLRIIQHQNQVKLAKRGVFINRNLEGKSLLHVDKNINTPMLLPYVPNFNKLDENNLPIGNGTLISYKDHFITWWGYQILEIDAKTHKYIREAIMPCSVDDLIVHESILFVLCKDRLPIEKSSIYYNDVSSVYTIDLNSGMLKDHYSPVLKNNSTAPLDTNIEQYPYITNLDFTYKYNSLWLGVRNGIVKINSTSGDIIFYNLNAFSCKYWCLTFLDNSSWSDAFPIRSNNSAVWTYAETQNKIILYIYNNKKDSWDSYSSENIEKSIPTNITSVFSGYNKIYFYYPISDKISDKTISSSVEYRIIVFDTITKKWTYLTDTSDMDEAQKRYFPGVVYQPGMSSKRFGPNFQIVSNKVNGRYYLLGNNGIYVLEKDTFPKKILDLDLEKIEGKLYNNGIYGTMYINNDETYILIIGRKGYPENGDNTVGKQVAILRIDLKSKKIIDIMKNSTISQQNIPVNGYLQQVMDLFFSNLKLLSTKDGISITGNLNPESSSDMRQIGEINLKTNTFELLYSCPNQYSTRLEDCLPKE